MAKTTDILSFIREIKEASQERNGYPPTRVLCTTAMRNRIVEAICEYQNWDYIKTRRKAVEKMKLFGMTFVMNYRMPDNELHFCTKRRELIVRAKVDQEPMKGTPEHG